MESDEVIFARLEHGFSLMPTTILTSAQQPVKPANFSKPAPMCLFFMAENSSRNNNGVCGGGRQKSGVRDSPSLARPAFQ